MAYITKVKLPGGNVYDIKDNNALHQGENIALTQDSTIPTAPVGDSSQKIANTEFVQNAIEGVLTSEMTFKGTTAILPSEEVNGDMYKVTANIAKTNKMDSSARIGDVIIYSSNDAIWHIVPSGDDIEDTWRPVQVNNSQILANGTTTSPLNLSNSTDILATNGNNGKVTFTHANKITAGIAQGTSGEIVFGGTLTIPTVTYDANGHITATGTTTVTLPVVSWNFSDRLESTQGIL